MSIKEQLERIAQIAGGMETHYKDEPEHGVYKDSRSIGVIARDILAKLID